MNLDDVSEVRMQETMLYFTLAFRQLRRLFCFRMICIPFQINGSHRKHFWFPQTPSLGDETT